MMYKEERKDYVLTFYQVFMGQVLTDSYIKHNQTIEEMEQAVWAVKTDPNVTECYYEEIK